MSLKTPVVLTIRSKDSGVSYALGRDGSASLSYCFPEPLSLREDHSVKLLYVMGPSQHVVVKANFVENQGFNQDPLMILGTSISGSNVYIPVRLDYITAIGWLTISNLDGSPMDEAEPIVLALHFVPTRLVSH